MMAASVVSVSAMTLYSVGELEAPERFGEALRLQVGGESVRRNEEPNTQQNSRVEVLTLANEARQVAGLPILSSDPTLDRLAEEWVSQLSATGELTHSADLTSGLSASGWVKLGENLGRGTTVSQIHQAWMNSESHRQNILDPGFDSIGVGVIITNGQLRIVQRFLETGGIKAPGVARHTDQFAPDRFSR
jgi:uncharacterized protein YkwD